MCNRVGQQYCVLFSSLIILLIDSLGCEEPQNFQSIDQAPQLQSPAPNASIATASPTFSWQQTANSNAYLIYIDQTTASSPIASITPMDNPTQSWTVLTPLTPGKHTWSIVAKNDFVRFESEMRVFTVVAPPDGLDQSFCDRNPVSIAWATNAVALDYELEISDYSVVNANGQFISPLYDVTSITAPPTVATGLPLDTPLFAHVRFNFSSSGPVIASEFGPIFNIVIHSAPLLPSNLTNSTVQCTPFDMTLGWYDPGDLTVHYELSRNDATFGVVFASGDIISPAHSAIVTILSGASGDIIYWRLQTADTTTGCLSDWVVGIPFVAEPAPIITANATIDCAANEITLTWNDPGADSFTVYGDSALNSSNYAGFSLASLGSGVSSLATGPWANGATIHFIVGGSIGSCNFTSSVLDVSIPNAPVLPVITSVVDACSPFTGDLTWSTVAGETYDVELSASGFTGTPTQSGITAGSYNPSPDPGPGTWIWQVRSCVVDCGCSIWSTQDSFIVSATPPVPVVSAIPGACASYTGSFAWTISGGATYDIEYSSTGLTSSPTQSGLASGSYNPSPDPGVGVWQIAVRACTAVCGCSSWSTPVSFTVAATPGVFTANSYSGSSTTPSLIWSAATSASQYSVSIYSQTSCPGTTLIYGPSIVATTTYAVPAGAGLIAGTTYTFIVTAMNTAISPSCDRTSCATLTISGATLAAPTVCALPANTCSDTRLPPCGSGPTAKYDMIWYAIPGYSVIVSLTCVSVFSTYYCSGGTIPTGTSYEVWVRSNDCAGNVSGWTVIGPSIMNNACCVAGCAC